MSAPRWMVEQSKAIQRNPTPLLSLLAADAACDRPDREWERECREIDEPDVDPLASVYADDEPQEWRA